jgi:enterobactin synthetase component D / holo-[acyl-carrier protein] synthase
MIEELLPDDVVAVDTHEDWLGIALFPDEEAALGQAVERRRREFATARGCARQALEQLGLPAASIPVGPHGEPQWPPGVVGSITHCRGYRACALALSKSVVAMGIDAEPHEGLRNGVFGAIANAEEEIWLRDLKREEPSVHWDRLVFSAKEAIFKTWFVLTKCRLDFDEIVITFDIKKRVFSARLLRSGRAAHDSDFATVDGRWMVRSGLIATAVALRRTPNLSF